MEDWFGGECVCVGLGVGWCDFGVVVVVVLKGGVKGGGSSVGVGVWSWD